MVREIEPHFPAWCEHPTVMCPHGALEAQIAPGLNPASQSAFAILRRLYATQRSSTKTSDIKERNEQIVARHQAGETLMEIARVFGITYQRVHQIIAAHRKRLD